MGEAPFAVPCGLPWGTAAGPVQRVIVWLPFEVMTRVS
jgi:hypothetical protein